MPNSNGFWAHNGKWIATGLLSAGLAVTPLLLHGAATAGAIRSDVKKNERDIDELKKANGKVADVLTDIRERVIRIETKVDALENANDH